VAEPASDEARVFSRYGHPSVQVAVGYACLAQVSREPACPSFVATGTGREAIMSDVTISDTGIAVMCDIARASGLDLDDDKQAVLDRLIADGLVAKSSAAKPTEAAKFEVTPKGQRMLDERGVGVNES
jgi:hypothetical protein